MICVVQGMILLVTENENVAQAVEQECVVLGRQMLRAGTGAGALETSKSRMLDMVIIDQHLPDTAGDQLAVRLRNLHMELDNVVIFTGRHSLEMPKSGEEKQQEIVTEESPILPKAGSEKDASLLDLPSWMDDAKKPAGGRPRASRRTLRIRRFPGRSPPDPFRRKCPARPRR